MNKAELIGAIAQKTGHSAATVGEVVACLESVITDEVTGGGKVTLPGFLAFDRSERAARSGRNPATGATIQIAAATVPRIKAGKAFKDAVGKK
ncbi:MAG: HU family DNA-binding protein [Acidimicrobiales bacterium]